MAPLGRLRALAGPAGSFTRGTPIGSGVVFNNFDVGDRPLKNALLEGVHIFTNSTRTI